VIIKNNFKKEKQMKKKLLVLSVITTLLLSLLVPTYAFAASPTQSGTVVSGPSGDPAMPLDGSWVVLDEIMSVGDNFTGPYTWDMPYLVRFTITDLFVVSDQFEVYDNGNLVVTTSSVPDWPDLLGVTDPFQSPPWTNSPDIALASGHFSSAVLYFSPGAHSVDIRDIHIPPLTAAEDSPPFPDGTVAFKAEPLAEFTKEITSTVEGGDMDGILEVGEKWTWTMTATLTNISGEPIEVTKMHDRLGGDLELVDLDASPLIGVADVYTKGKTEKVFINWYDGFTLGSGESVSANITVSPDVNTGTGNGKKAGHQEYTSPGIHCLNSGASFAGYIGDESIEASTAPVCVEVVEVN
jgi:hypothetical protein